MRITVLTSSYPRFEGDGTAPFVASISEQLAKLGHQVEVVAPYDPAVDTNHTTPIPVHRFRYIWPQRLHIMGHAKSLAADVRLRPLVYLLLPFFLMAAFRKLYQVVRRQKAQIVHVHWVLPNGPVAALVARLRGIPLVVSLHGSDIYVAQKNRLFGAVARWVFRNAGAVSACSQGLKLSALELGSPIEPSLITWGADPQIFRPLPRDEYTLNKLEVSRSNLCVVALGRLVHKKGFDILINVWKRISAAFPSARLIIAGEGPLRPILSEQAKALGIAESVILPGRVPWNQVPGLFSCADLFILPSIIDKHGNIDGLPTVLLEAMSCGLPVIASQIGGMSEVIDNHQNGVLVPAGNEAALAEAIQELLENPAKRESLGLEARRSITNALHWEQVAKEFISLFDESIRRAFSKSQT
jgi:glycosyltransferase involved in cell wall biosynthesis